MAEGDGKKGERKRRPFKRNRANIQFAQLRRAALFEPWQRGVSAYKAARMQFTVEGDGGVKQDIGPFALSTVRDDYAWLEKKLGRFYRKHGTFGRVISGLWRVVEQANEAAEDQEEGKDRVGALREKREALAEIARLTGLRVDRVENLYPEGVPTPIIINVQAGDAEFIKRLAGAGDGDGEKEQEADNDGN